MAENESNFYEFGRFRLEAGERVLLRDRELVPLTPKVFDILLALVEQGGHVVQKDDLMKRVWPGTFVEDGNLTQSVSILRKALGESPGGTQFIETIPKRGYRFVATVKGAGRDEVPFSLASIFQVAKSARALVSARRAINMSAALIKMASGLCGVSLRADYILPDNTSISRIR